MNRLGLVWLLFVDLACSVVVQLSTLTEFHFDHTPALFGPGYGAGISGRLVLARPLDACLPNLVDGSSWSNGSIVVFRADCCHVGFDPVGDCYFAQRSIIAQLYHASAAIIGNCNSPGNESIAMTAPQLPLSIAPNVTQITIPTVSVGCDFIEFVSSRSQSDSMWATIDGRDEVEIEYLAIDFTDGGYTMPWWAIMIVIFLGIVGGACCICSIMFCKYRSAQNQPVQNVPVEMASVTRVLPMNHTINPITAFSEPSQSSSQASRNISD